MNNVIHVDFGYRKVRQNGPGSSATDWLLQKIEERKNAGAARISQPKRPRLARLSRAFTLRDEKHRV